MKLEFNLTPGQTDVLCYGLGCDEEFLHEVLMKSFFGSKDSLFYRNLGYFQKNIQKYCKQKRIEGVIEDE